MLNQVQHDKFFRDVFCGVIPDLIRDLKGTGFRSMLFGQSGKKRHKQMLKQVQHDKSFRDVFCGVIPNLIRDLKGTGLRSESFGERGK